MLKYLPLYASNSKFANLVDEWIRLNDRLLVLLSENESILSRITTLKAIDLEFNSSMPAMSSDGPITSEMITDISVMTDVIGEELKEVVPDMSQMRYIKTSYDLNKFFERPIQVGSFSIAAGGSYENLYRVCDLYLNDSTVRSKLRNFSYLRARFCVRIVVSGTQFNYGRLMCAAYPWATDILALNELYQLGATWDKLKLQYLSQSRYSSVIDLKENRPLEFELPWIGPMHVGRLYNKSSSALGSATSLDDFKEMWSVYIKTLNPMDSTQVGGTNNNCYIYVYLKDVELGVPTATQTAIVTNSSVTDERKTGPVEKISSSLLAVSRGLEMVPYIGMYAKASSFVLAGISGVASLFGWSAPIIHSVPSRVKNEPFQNGANLIQCDTGQRLTLDPKQELSISTDYLSIDHDELTIANMCKVQSYMNTFTWSESTASLSPLQYYYVHPRVSSTFVATPSGVVNFVPSPMHFACCPFTKWHGDIDYTFEIVCSSFHKGKILVVYEPNIYAYTGTIANQAINKQFSYVVDIQETQKFTIRVGWNQPRQWMNNLTGSESAISSGTVLSGITASVSEAVNGFIYILPLTKLQSPDSSDVSINVYVKSMNMRFNRVDNLYMPGNRNLEFNSSCCNVEDTISVINESALSESGMYDNFYGEAPLTFRSIMKRFISLPALPAPSYSAAPTRYRLTSSLYADRLNAPGTSTTNSSMFGYLRYAFLAMRGSMRKRINLYTSGNLYDTPIIVRQFNDSSGQPSVPATSTSAGTIGGLSLVGSLMFVTSTNAGIEFELPFYNNNLFCFACSASELAPNCPMFNNTVNSNVYSVDLTPGSTKTYLAFHESEATGEDFQMAYFIGAVPFRI